MESFRILNLLHSRSESEKPPLSIPKASQSSASSQSPAFCLLSFQSSQSSTSSQSRALSVSFSLSLLYTLALYTFALSTLALVHSHFCSGRSLRSSSKQKLRFLFRFRLKVALLSDYSCKRMFFFLFVEWFACKVLVFMRFLMEKEVFLVVSLFCSGSGKVFAFRVWFLLVLK